MKRLIGLLLALLVAVAVLAVGLILFLGTSERGTRLLADQAERLLPLTLSDFSGTLWSELRAGRVALNLEAFDLEIEELVVAVRLWPLIFENELHVLRGAARAVIYRPGAGAAESSEPARLQLPSLPLQIRVDQAQLDSLQLGDREIADISVSGLWTNERLAIEYLDARWAGLSLALGGRMEHGANPVLSVEFIWSYPQHGIEGSGSLVGLVSQLKIDHKLAGDYRGRIQGQLDLSRLAEPGFDLDVAAEPFTLGQVGFQDLQGTVEGTLADLRMRAKAKLGVQALAPFPVAATLSGSLSGSLSGPLALSFAGEPLSGDVAGSGHFSWSEGIDLVVSGQVQRLDLSQVLDELEGRVGGMVGVVYRNDRLQVDVSDLSGEINQRPVDGALQLDQLDDGWRVEADPLQIGENRLTGALDLMSDGISVSAEIAAPELSGLDLGIEGDLTGSVSARGRWPDLQGAMEFSSRSLSGFGVTSDGLEGRAELTEKRLSAAASAERLDARGVPLDHVRVGLNGAPDALAWQLDWQDGQLAGGYAREGEAHRVAATRIEVQALGEQWTIDDEVILVFSNGDLEVSRFCLSGGQSRACLSPSSYRDGTVSSSGRLQQLPLAMASPWLPLPIRDDGYLQGEWVVEGTPGQWQGRFELAARSLFLLLPDVEEAAIELPDLEIEGELDAGQLGLRASAVDPEFSVTGAATVAPAGPDGSLKGHLRLAASDLSALRAFDHRIEEIGGAMRGYVVLSGTLKEPRFEGSVQIVDAGLRLNDPDLTLADLDARVTLDDSGAFELKAAGSNESGNVLVEGSGAGLFDGALEAHAALRGSHLQAGHPDWEVVLSPDLKLDYAEGKGRIHGRVEIPTAHVRLNTLPSSIPSPSDDVVVVGREKAPRGSIGRMAVDVNLVLGDDVSLSAAGVQAKLIGTLNARLDERGRTSVRGKLDVSGGIVSAQGQTLTVEEGSIVYNGPITNPYLDLRAVRIIDDRTPPIKVGLHIRGTADDLTTSVFSDPAMSEARALSFLVLGRDLEEGTSGDSSQVLAAAINLGLSRAGSITSDIKRLAGLDELSAVAESQQSFAIVAGKRITEDMYVRYTYDTLTAMSALLVRYSLTDRWHLEARSSEYSSMDLMYMFEK